ncbi:UNVERIFIED_CONTAM: histidine kinase [Euhalothece sp. KZN 001]
MVKVQQLPRLSQMMGTQKSSPLEARDQLQGWREWYGAIGALNALLASIEQGIILSSPTPIINSSQSKPNLTSVVFTPNLSFLGEKGSRLLGVAPVTPRDNGDSPQVQSVPLSAHDPLQNEQFCLVLTPEFSLLMVLTLNADGESHFDFSFDPDVTQPSWLRLRSRLQSNAPEKLQQLESKQFPFCAPDYRLVSQFTREMLAHLPREQATNQNSKITPSSDVELLQALTHEVRTPLTTIRMLTRLLLKRKDLGADVQKRLRVIDQECTEQINRMELIFQATELEGKNESEVGVNLTPTPLEELLNKNIPYWKKQAKRRNVELDVILPEQLPTVISNPQLLTQVLTGLMENFTSRLGTGGKMKIQVTTAGSQIKLQLLSQSYHPQSLNQSIDHPQEKSIGQLLTLQPETGNLSLNLNVTKNLFEAIGGKLTVRQRAETGEVLTVFLPANLIKSSE